MRTRPLATQRPVAADRRRGLRTRRRCARRRAGRPLRPLPAPDASYAGALRRNLPPSGREPGRPRTARFICALAAVRGTDVVFETTGTIEGEVSAPSRAERTGFGYDPIFFYPPYGRTLAEVDDEQKLRVAHRGSCASGILVGLAGGRNIERRTLSCSPFHHPESRPRAKTISARVRWGGTCRPVGLTARRKELHRPAWRVNCQIPLVTRALTAGQTARMLHLACGTETWPRRVRREAHHTPRGPIPTAAAPARWSSEDQASRCTRLAHVEARRVAVAVSHCCSRWAVGENRRRALVSNGCATTTRCSTAHVLTQENPY